MLSLKGCRNEVVIIEHHQVKLVGIKAAILGIHAMASLPIHTVALTRMLVVANFRT